MGLSNTVSEINSHFSRKSLIFPIPVYLTPRWMGSPWNWVSVLGVKKLEWWDYWAEKEIWRCLQPCEYNTWTWWMDTRRPKDSTFTERRAVKICKCHTTKCCTLRGNLYNTVSVELTFHYSALITFEYSVFLPITLHFVESLCTHGRAIRKCVCYSHCGYTLIFPCSIKFQFGIRLMWL